MLVEELNESSDIDNLLLQQQKKTNVNFLHLQAGLTRGELGAEPHTLPLTLQGVKPITLFPEALVFG